MLELAEEREERTVARPVRALTGAADGEREEQLRPPRFKRATMGALSWEPDQEELTGRALRRLARAID